MMKIKPISFPFIRIRICDADYKPEKFFELPDFELSFKPIALDKPVDPLEHLNLDPGFRAKFPHVYGKPKQAPNQKIPVIVERFLRQNNVTAKEILPMVKKSIETVTRSPDFIEQYGPLTLAAHQNELMQMLEGQRYYTGLRSWKDRETNTCTNSIAVELGRGTTFTLLVGNERPYRVPQEHMILGSVTAFGSRSQFAISHPFMNLREVFTYEYITETVTTEILTRFPFLKEHGLFKDFVLEEF